MDDFLKKFTADDIEKLKELFSPFADKYRNEVITLRVFTEEYLQYIKDNRSIAYYTSIGISLKHFCKYFGVQRPIYTIRFKEVESFVTKLQQIVTKGYRVYVRTLKAAFNKAIDWGYIQENHFKKIKLPKKQKVNPAFINSTELKAICVKISKPVLREIIITGFYTGLRLNEIVNLAWKNTNLHTRIITVGDENFTTKGRNQRYVPISDELYNLLLQKHCSRKIFKLNNDYIFCKENGELYTGSYSSKVFKKACRAAGINNAIHFHSLRHSFASNLVQNDVSLYTIKELLGHSSITTTEIYSHLNMDALKNAIKKLNNNN